MRLFARKEDKKSPIEDATVNDTTVIHNHEASETLRSIPNPPTSSFTIASCVTIFFQCLSCCNCILLIVLGGMVLYELEQVRTLQAALAKDQDMMSTIQDEVREKQDIKIEELHQEVVKEHNLTFLTLAGFFTLLTCLISMFHISSHLQKMNQPIIQRKIVAIIWMSPIYSVTSFLSLLYPPMEEYMAIIKDFYESYCIYTFLSFLIVVLGRGSRENAVEVLSHRADHLENPTRCLAIFYDPPPDTSEIAKANAVITECQIFAMQFVFIRPLTTVISVIYNATSDEGGSDSESAEEVLNNTGHRVLEWLRILAVNATDSTSIVDPSAPSPSPLFSPTMAAIDTFAPTISPRSASEQEFEESAKAYFQSVGFILTMIVNISVVFAFTGLLKFYHSVHKDLAWCRPWPKFLTIKGTWRITPSMEVIALIASLYSPPAAYLNTGVVFLTFWQGLAILILVNLSEGSNDGDVDSAAGKGRRYQNILICCEMLFFSLTHWCVFPAEEWEKGYEPPTQTHQVGIGIQDFVSDMGQIYRRRRRNRTDRTAPTTKRSSSHRGGTGIYHHPGMSATFMEEDEQDDDETSMGHHPVEGSGRILTTNSRDNHLPRPYDDDSSSESYSQDVDHDLGLQEKPAIQRPPPNDQSRGPSQFQRGSSTMADVEDDDMELI